MLCSIRRHPGCTDETVTLAGFVFLSFCLLFLPLDEVRILLYISIMGTFSCIQRVVCIQICICAETSNISYWSTSCPVQPLGFPIALIVLKAMWTLGCHLLPAGHHWGLNRFAFELDFLRSLLNRTWSCIVIWRLSMAESVWHRQQDD